jgi:hypothetical protein
MPILVRPFSRLNNHEQECVENSGDKALVDQRTKDMQMSIGQHEGPGIVYRVACQNRGCGHTFDLWITAKQAGILAGTIDCPRCRRPGGMLKPTGRLGDRVFSAKLVFKLTGVGPTLPAEEKDLVTDIS